MSPVKCREKKDQQMNVRFTSAEIAALDQIAEIEDRDRAYLVGFFTRWGMKQWARVGSLVVLREKKVSHEARVKQIDTGAISRLQLREEVTSGEEERGNGGSSPSTTARKAR